jgi:hypothetical protein
VIDLKLRHTTPRSWCWVDAAAFGLVIVIEGKGLPGFNQSKTVIQKLPALHIITT